MAARTWDLGLTGARASFGDLSLGTRGGRPGPEPLPVPPRPLPPNPRGAALERAGRTGLTASGAGWAVPDSEIRAEDRVARPVVCLVLPIADSQVRAVFCYESEEIRDEITRQLEPKNGNEN